MAVMQFTLYAAISSALRQHPPALALQVAPAVVPSVSTFRADGTQTAGQTLSTSSLTRNMAWRGRIKRSV